MRIGMVLDKLFPPDLRVEKEALSLIKAGHEVYLLCLGKGKANKPVRSDYKNIHLHRLFPPMWFIDKTRALTNTVLNVYPRLWSGYIGRFIRQYDIGVLHIHDLYLFKSALMARAEIPGNIPIVGDLHENYVDALPYYRFSSSFPGNLLISQKKWKKVEQEWIRQMDFTVTVIDEMKERIKPFVRDASTIYVVDNAVHIEEFLNYEKDDSIRQKYEGKFVLSYIGGIDYHRGLNTVFDALSMLTDLEDLVLSIVGRKKNLGMIMPKLKALDISDKVIFEGFQPPGRLQNYFDMADVGIIPHYKTVQTDNSSPNKLYQYMLMGKPVVATDCTSVQNILESSRSGLIYESGNADQLADCIRTLYNDRQLISTLGGNGRRAVYEKYNWTRNATRLAELYSRILKER